MPDLVALTDPPGPEWLSNLQRWWDAGAAVLPVDHRLPPRLRAELLDRLRPTHVAEGDDVTRRADGIPVQPGDALVVATSGTTGAPKGVILTHDAVHAAAHATNQALAVDPATDRWIACLPLAHVGGLGVVTRALLSDTPVTILPGFDAEAVTAEARHPARRPAPRSARGPAPRPARRPAPGPAPRPARRPGRPLISLVPTTLLRVDPALFRVIVVGGTAPPPHLPPNARFTYGMTETMGGCVYDGLALPGTTIDVTPTGEVVIDTPSLARAYRADGRETPIPRPFPTGDGGRLDAHNRLQVDGRLADVIVTGGEKVWPASVEEALGNHPGVRQVLVFGTPDPEWGHRVVARVVPVDPAAPPTLEDLRALARDRLAPYALPRELQITATIPTTALGKIFRTQRSEVPGEA